MRGGGVLRGERVAGRTCCDGGRALVVGSDNDVRGWAEQQVAACLAVIGIAYADAKFKYGGAFTDNGANGKLPSAVSKTKRRVLWT